MQFMGQNCAVLIAILFGFSGGKKGGKEGFLYAYTEVNATDNHPTHVSRGGGDPKKLVGSERTLVGFNCFH